MKFRTLLFIVLVLGPSQLFSATTDFPRTLRVGMSGDDVKALQIFMNKDRETRVAGSGAGSPGNETTYFGLATKRAVGKFQEKYRAEILTPVGLSTGSGFFGDKTRAKVLALQEGNTNSPLSPLSASPVEKGEVVVMFLSRYSGTSGTTITITGSGFTQIDNTIYFGEKYAVIKASSSSGGQGIIFNVPQIPKGVYHIFVKNARGESNKDSFFVVTDGVTPEPKIESTVINANKEVVIRGTGFLKGNNMVRTGTGIYEGVVSVDGTTITVPAITIPKITESSSFPGLPQATIFTSAPNNITPVSIPVWVLVVNEDGISNTTSFTQEL